MFWKTVWRNNSKHSCIARPTNNHIGVASSDEVNIFDMRGSISKSFEAIYIVGHTEGVYPLCI